MSGFSTQDAYSFGAAKQLYDEDIQMQQNIRSSLFNFIRKAKSGEVNLDGDYWNIACMFQQNESYGAITGGERIPEAGITKSIFAKYRPKQSYSGMEAETFAAVMGGNGGLVGGKLIDTYVKSTLTTFISNIDFDCYSNGRGYRATVLAATPAATSFQTYSAQRIRQSMIFDWYDATYTTKKGTIRIADVDYPNRTSYIDPTFGTGQVPATAVATDVLVVYKALDPGEPIDGRFAAGLMRITDNTVSIGTISPTDQRLWSCPNINVQGQNPSQEVFQQQFDWSDAIANKYPNKCALNPAFKRGYLNQFFGQRQFTSNSYDTGATSLTFSPVRMGMDEKKQKPRMAEILEDKNSDPDTVYMWSDEALCIATQYSDVPHIGDEDGSDFRLKIGYDAMFGFYRYWWNTIVNQRAAISKSYGYTVASGVL